MSNELAAIWDADGLPEAYPSQPIRYLDRTRAYYRRLGYAPYRWSHTEEVAFTPLRKALAESRVVLLTTAAPYEPDRGDQGPGAAYNGGAKFFDVYAGSTLGEPDTRISHIGYDRTHTSAKDQNTWFPLHRLREAAATGRIGGIATQFLGIPTMRSQRVTIEQHAPEASVRCHDLGADVALLVPNCPVCHQSLSLVAQQLERDGIPTVVLGAAKDIVEHVGVPRFAFSDVPLGNAAGRPFDVASQQLALESAFRLLECAAGPRSTWQTAVRWNGENHSWKCDFMNTANLDAERARASFDAEKERAASVKAGVQ